MTVGDEYLTGFVLALLAHGDDRGVTIRPDGTLVAASPPAELSPVGLSEEQLRLVDACRPDGPEYSFGDAVVDSTRHTIIELVAIIDALLASPVGPQREGLALRDREVFDTIEQAWALLDDPEAEQKERHQMAERMRRVILQPLADEDRALAPSRENPDPRPEGAP